MKRYLKILLLACLVSSYYAYRNLNLAEQVQLSVYSQLDCEPQSNFEVRAFLIVKYTGLKFMASVIKDSSL